MTALFLAAYIGLLSNDRWEVREAAQAALASHRADDDQYRVIRLLRATHPHPETRSRLRPVVARWTPAAAERCLPRGCPVWPQIDVVSRGFSDDWRDEETRLDRDDPRRILLYGYDQFDGSYPIPNDEVDPIARMNPIYYGWRVLMKRRASVYLGLTGDFDGLRCALHRGWQLELVTADSDMQREKIRPFLQDWVQGEPTEYPPDVWAAYEPEYLSYIGRLCPDILNKQYLPR